eukprot:Amastigsp_a841033_413.p2 type:complete len:199 gc:universal Amastigsp_a841033_413:735-139(-)
MRRGVIRGLELNDLRNIPEDSVKKLWLAGGQVSVPTVAQRRWRDRRGPCTVWHFPRRCDCDRDLVYAEQRKESLRNMCQDRACSRGFFCDCSHSDLLLLRAGRKQASATQRLQRRLVLLLRLTGGRSSLPGRNRHVQVRGVRRSRVQVLYLKTQRAQSRACLEGLRSPDRGSCRTLQGSRPGRVPLLAGRSSASRGRR